jgi:hypothetical protein
METQKMTNETVEKAKADAKKGIADIGNKMAHAKADLTADAYMLNRVSITQAFASKSANLGMQRSLE